MEATNPARSSRSTVTSRNSNEQQLYGQLQGHVNRNAPVSALRIWAKPDRPTTRSYISCISRLEGIGSSPSTISRDNTVTPDAEQSSAMIASIVDARLANLNQGSQIVQSVETRDSMESSPQSSLPVSLSVPNLAPALQDPIDSTPALPQPIYDGQDGVSVNLGNPEVAASLHTNYCLPSLASHPAEQCHDSHHER